jgi:hypothetical protein
MTMESDNVNFYDLTPVTITLPEAKDAMEIPARQSQS